MSKFYKILIGIFLLFSILANGKEFENMVVVKGGKYLPSFSNEEKKVFDLEVSKFLVTYEEWYEIMDPNYQYYNPSFGRKPMEHTQWWQALEYCNRLSEKNGLKPVYDLSQEKQGILKINQLDGKTVSASKADFSKTEGFRLPTELEWEWFARGGEVAQKEGTFDYKYSGSNNIDEVAWYRENSNYKVQEVGGKKANQLGIYDCSGNMWEWCYDTDDPQDDIEKLPAGLLYKYDEKKAGRRMRGQAWVNYPEKVLITERYAYHGGSNSSTIGFRVVRTKK